MMVSSLPLPAATSACHRGRHVASLESALRPTLARRKRDQPAVVIILQTARLVVEIGQDAAAGRYRESLSTCSWSCDHRKRHFGMGQHIGHLLGDGVGIDRHRDSAERLAGAHRPVEAADCRRNGELESRRV